MKIRLINKTKRNPLTPFEKGGMRVPPFSKGVRGFLNNFEKTITL